MKLSFIFFVIGGLCLFLPTTSSLSNTIGGVGLMILGLISLAVAFWPSPQRRR